MPPGRFHATCVSGAPPGPNRVLQGQQKQNEAKEKKELLYHKHIYIYIYICLFSWGGGTRELMEVLAVAADFSEYGVPKGGGGYVIPFRKALKKGFSKLLELGPNSPICRNAGPRNCNTWVRNSLFCGRAGCTYCTCIPVQAEFRNNVVP